MRRDDCLNSRKISSIITRLMLHTIQTIVIRFAAKLPYKLYRSTCSIRTNHPNSNLGCCVSSISLTLSGNGCVSVCYKTATSNRVKFSRARDDRGTELLPLPNTSQPSVCQPSIVPKRPPVVVPPMRTSHAALS